ncbi:MAG: 5-histidylcysteine sulfoxide synthase [Candidatus Cloacimonetes bacterium]|nr:5-histidylcysteine sulfoxide synthase [Candidatus Cloacimonadota bacterium]
MNDLVTRTIILNLGSVAGKRKEILEYFRKTVQIEEKLFATFKDDSTYYLRADPLRHPLIFYFGHTAVFYINKLVLAKYLGERINPHFESIFAVGVDEMSWDDLNEAHYDWPAVAEIRSYRARVWEVVEDMISRLPLKLPITWDEPFWVIMMGIEHQRIHLETSSVLIRQLPLAALKPVDFWKVCPERGESPENELVNVPGGMVKLGKSFDNPLYGWDNEFGSREIRVKPFKTGKYLVSNQEFLEFIEDKGYHTRDYWTEEGWNWKSYEKVEHPRFWRKKKDGGYQLRLMLEGIPLPWNWPVELNYLEAKAFCNWKSKKTGKPLRLPTEAEWYRIYNTGNIPDQPYWDNAPGNINLEHWASPCPVDKFEFGKFYDVIGNVWQWTETPISGFNGFKVHPYYDDFSTPTFDNKHNLIKGGSWISTGNEATRDARYAFRRHFYQHAGFRYVETAEPVVIESAVYEEDPDVSLRCEFNYGREYGNVPLFSVKAAAFCINAMKGRKLSKALNLGCDVGRTTFELARYFDHVTGLDFTARYIRLAIQMQEKGRILYTLPEEGELVSFHEISLEELGLAGTENKVDFWQADASNLKPQYTGYDLIYVQNLLERIYDPEKFLQLVHERMNTSGLLIISSLYDWNEQYTAKNHWLGGYREDGEPVWSSERLTWILQQKFYLLGNITSIPLLKRIKSRVFFYGESEFSVWELRH